MTTRSDLAFAGLPYTSTIVTMTSDDAPTIGSKMSGRRVTLRAVGVPVGGCTDAVIFELVKLLTEAETSTLFCSCTVLEALITV